MTNRFTDEKHSHHEGGNDFPTEGGRSEERTLRKERKDGTEWTRDVLDAIIREAKAGSVKHQELFLKYRNHFDLACGDEDPTEIVYEAHFIDDKAEDPEAL